MRSLPFGHARGDFGVVLRQLAELSQHVLLGGARRLGDERRGAEELTRRIASSLHLKETTNLSVFRHGQGDEADHSSGQHTAKGQEVWAHGP
jgi:hypothetical protein